MSVCMNNSTSIFLIKATHSTGNPLEFLRNLPQFQMLRTVLQQNPGMLQALLQQIGQSNPQLLQVSLRIFHMTEIYNVHVAWDPGDEAILCLVPRLRYMGRDPGDEAILSVSFPDPLKACEWGLRNSFTSLSLSSIFRSFFLSPPLSSPLLPSPPCPPSSTPVHPGDQSKPPGIHWPLEQCSTRSCRTGSRPSRGWGSWPGSPSTGGCTIWDAHDHPSYSSRKRSYWEGRHWMWTHTITITLTLSRHHTLPGHSKSPQHTLLQWPHDPPNVEPAAYKFSLQVEPYKSTRWLFGAHYSYPFFFFGVCVFIFSKCLLFSKKLQK